MPKHSRKSDRFDTPRPPRDGKRDPRAKQQTAARKQQRAAKRAIQGR